MACRPPPSAELRFADTAEVDRVSTTKLRGHDSNTRKKQAEVKQERPGCQKKLDRRILLLCYTCQMLLLRGSFPHETEKEMKSIGPTRTCWGGYHSEF